MPQCTHSTIVHAPLSTTWAFVAEMDNWAPLLTGYQGHEKHDEKVSTWRLRGDVGMLSREVELRVEITDWREGERVDFTLSGVNEQVDGDGTFTITSHQEDTAPNPDSDGDPVATEVGDNASRGWFASFFVWLARLLFRAQHGQQKALQAVVDEHVQLQFRLRMEAGGPMAPMINAMLQPAILPATEDLAVKIANRVLQIHRPEASQQLEANSPGAVGA